MRCVSKRIDLNFGIQIAQTVRGGFDFRPAHVAGAEKHLPLKIREIDNIEIYQADAADARRRKIKPERRAQPAGADAENFRLLELELPVHADFGHDQVPAVAQDFVLRSVTGGLLAAGATGIPVFVAI